MKADISGDTIFEDLVDQIEDNVDAVALQNPYTSAQIVSIAFTIVDRSGFYADDCRDWKRKPSTSKTWPNFQAHFSLAFKEARTSNRTTKAGGYTANKHLKLPTQQS